MAGESLIPATEQREITMQTLTLEQETNPWEAQAARFDFAAKKLNLDQGLWKVLRQPVREIIVQQRGRIGASDRQPLPGQRLLNNPRSGAVKPVGLSY